MQIRPHLIAGAMGKPVWDESFAPDPIAIYRACAFSDLWQDAGMPEVVQYLRGNSHLKLPDEWRSVLPASL
jgi:hypothetical protein